MHRFFRYFAIGSLAAVLVAGMLITGIMYQRERQEHVTVAEREHLAFTRLLQNSLAESYKPLLQPRNMTPAQLSRRKRALREDIARLTASSGILKLKLFNLQGVEVFASRDEARHEEPLAAERVNAALREGVVSALVSASREPEFGSNVANVFQTYTAIYDRTQRPVGVLELYSDITDELEELKHETWWLGSSLAAVFLSLYGVLLLIVRRADRLILQHDRERADYLSKLEREKLRAEAGDCAKRELLANISHEIRTPMNQVLGTADLLRQTPLDSRQQRYLATITDGGEALLQVIDRILSLSRDEQGAVGEERVFSPREVVMTVLRQYRHAAEDKGLELSCSAVEEIGLVLGEPIRLGLVLSNLLDNAIKFTDRRSVSMTMSRTREEGEKVRVRFSVRDTGFGIDRDQHERVFEPFVQLDGTTARRHQGSGVGLALVKRIVRDLGGDVGVESVNGEGCEFWFELPFTRAADMEAAV